MWPVARPAWPWKPSSRISSGCWTSGCSELWGAQLPCASGCCRGSASLVPATENSGVGYLTSPPLARSWGYKKPGAQVVWAEVNKSFYFLSKSRSPSPIQAPCLDPCKGVRGDAPGCRIPREPLPWGELTRKTPGEVGPERSLQPQSFHQVDCPPPLFSTLQPQPLLQLCTSPASNSEGRGKAERGLGFVPFLAESSGTGQGGARKLPRKEGSAAP